MFGNIFENQCHYFSAIKVNEVALKRFPIISPVTEAFLIALQKPFLAWASP
ncbi:hypothetical protein D3C87_2163900 [compost metagenome]